MTELNFALHPAQLEILRSPARFRVVAAGRRFGKSYLSAVELILAVMEDRPQHIDCWYVAPTFKLGIEVIWPYLMELGEPIWQHKVAHEGMAQARNGRWLKVRGADRPDLLRGKGLGLVVLDEYGTMKPETWEYVIRPTLADVKGRALFIGTPTGKNHFYELLLDAETSEDMDTWQFTSYDNPFLDRGELDHAKGTMSHLAFHREFMASFTEGSGTEFSDEQIEVSEEPLGGSIYMTVDPAGYSDTDKLKGSKYSKQDDTAIAIVKVHETGWHVLDIVTGRWGIRETSVRILQLARKHRPVCVGIEKGVLKAAIMPYLLDQMRRLSVFFSIREVSHGNQRKFDRIVWALQGRMEHGRITFTDGEYLRKFREQLLDFPSKRTHDDMLDALAYIDQIATTDYRGENWQEDTWEPIDAAAGY